VKVGTCSCSVKCMCLNNMQSALHGGVAQQSLFVGNAARLLCTLQKIEPGALWMEVAAVVVLGGTVFAFDYFNSSDSGYYTY